jgi:hypothetical protein
MKQGYTHVLAVAMGFADVIHIPNLIQIDSDLQTFTGDTLKQANQ